MSQQAKGLTLKPDNPSSIPVTHVKAEGDDRLHQRVLWPPHLRRDTCAHAA